jgi:hypothetical protein
MENLSPVEKMIAAIGCNKSELGRRMGVSPQHIQYWISAKRIPQHRLVKASEVSGIPVAELIA